MLRLLLVSESPRRRKILSDAGFLFTADIVKISEIIEENVNLEQAICAVAKAKGQAYLKIHNYLKSEDYLVVSADTMVCFEGRALGKPKNSTEAEEYLVLMAGKPHRVITALYLYNSQSGEEFLGYDSTKVLFKNSSVSEIKDYVATGEPLDKAGAYAIQGLGSQLVEKIEGSYNNVVGFPLELFEKVLKEKKWHVGRK